MVYVCAALFTLLPLIGSVAGIVCIQKGYKNGVLRAKAGAEMQREDTLKKLSDQKRLLIAMNLTGVMYGILETVIILNWSGALDAQVTDGYLTSLRWAVCLIISILAAVVALLLGRWSGKMLDQMGSNDSISASVYGRLGSLQTIYIFALVIVILIFKP